MREAFFSLPEPNRSPNIHKIIEAEPAELCVEENAFKDTNPQALLQLNLAKDPSDVPHI